MALGPDPKQLLVFQNICLNYFVLFSPSKFSADLEQLNEKAHSNCNTKSMNLNWYFVFCGNKYLEFRIKYFDVTF